jgi:hypothetical protein
MPEGRNGLMWIVDELNERFFSNQIEITGITVYDDSSHARGAWLARYWGDDDKGSIVLNCKYMDELHGETLRQVIFHEMCHQIHSDHGKQFQKLMQCYHSNCPEETRAAIREQNERKARYRRERKKFHARFAVELFVPGLVILVSSILANRYLCSPSRSLTNSLFEAFCIFGMVLGAYLLFGSCVESMEAISLKLYKPNALRKPSTALGNKGWS